MMESNHVSTHRLSTRPRRLGGLFLAALPLLGGLMLGGALLARPAAALPISPVTPPARADVRPATAQAAPLPGDYVLSPDDQLEISVLGHEEFRAAVTVLPDGSFNYPVLGKVHAAGMTVDALTAKLTKGLGKQLNQPEVTVYLRQGRARKVSVLGDGGKGTGQFEFKTGMHLLDLLASAGGLAAEPQLVQATLVPAGGGQPIPISLSRLLADADTSQNLPLAPGDVLFLVARNPEVGQVQVVGEVAKPGAYSIMPSGVSVLALLNSAGGALPTARLTQAQILHAGQVQVFDLRPLLTTDLSASAGRLRLVPGDVLLVPANKNRVLALGEVRSPGVLAIPDDQPLVLTTAYALVGGATPDGDKKNVDVIRRDPSGKATLLAINMEDLLKGKNGVTDITMQPNDILFIQTRNRPKSVGDIIGSLGALGFLAQSARFVGL